MEGAGVPWTIFISVAIAMFSFILAVGIIAITTKTTLLGETKHNNDKFVDLNIQIEKRAAEHKLDLEKVRTEHKLDLEKARLEHKAELEKIHDKKDENTIFYTTSISAFNTTLTRFELTMKGFELTLTHMDETVKEINASLKEQSKRISTLERVKN